MVNTSAHHGVENLNPGRSERLSSVQASYREHNGGCGGDDNDDERQGDHRVKDCCSLASAGQVRNGRWCEDLGWLRGKLEAVADH